MYMCMVTSPRQSRRYPTEVRRESGIRSVYVTSVGLCQGCLVDDIRTLLFASPVL